MVLTLRSLKFADNEELMSEFCSINDPIIISICLGFHVNVTIAVGLDEYFLG